VAGEGAAAGGRRQLLSLLALLLLYTYKRTNTYRSCLAGAGAAAGCRMVSVFVLLYV
jgi:hypothetical protein